MVVSSPSRTVQVDLLAPLSGLMVPLASVPDPVFARGLAGDGVSIDPTSRELLAPLAGTVTQFHGARHALAITSDEGLEVLLHVGLDTVMLKGEGFRPAVTLGDRVEAGQLLLTFDPVLVGRRARSLLTQMVVANGERVGSMTAATGLVVAGRDRALRVVLAPDPGVIPAPGGWPEVATCATLLSRAVALPNRAGLHARPAAVLAGEARKYDATVLLVREGREVNAKSVVAILGLEARQGDLVQVRATGADAPEAVAALADLLEAGSGEAAGTGEGETPLPAQAPSVPGTPGAGELAGIPASPGFAVGRVFQVRREAVEVREEGQGKVQERRHLEVALREAGLQIEGMRARMSAQADATRAGILSAHQELLLDPGLAGLAFEGIGQGRSAAYAWREAYERQATLLAAMASPLMKERALDIRDVGRRVLALLAGTVQTRLEIPPDAILVAEEFTPSETAQLDPARVLGLVTTTGGPTGHMAILARSLGIPAICGMAPSALEIPDQTLVVLDGTRGILGKDPGEADLLQAMARLDLQAARRAGERAAALKPAMTADGYRVEVAANIRSAREAREAVAAGAEGVGLLRSEFLFHDRESAPTEEEQTAEYAAVAGILGPGRRLVIRTLDVGGDKPLAYLPLPREDNPFLGLRGIRVSLDQPALFRIQLRALLRAAHLGDLHIMFPMVATLGEFRAARTILREEAEALGASAKVGVMIEVPSAALISDALAREADFLSIGTNDLTQYCLAMDRGHPRLAAQADALHPAVLKLIALTVESAHRHGRWVGVCGGLASDALALPALLGLGVDEFSVSVPAIGTIKSRLSRLDRAECRALALELLDLGTAAEVRERLSTLAE